jgi:hypothetical protein
LDFGDSIVDVVDKSVQKRKVFEKNSEVIFFICVKIRKYGTNSYKQPNKISACAKLDLREHL